MNSLVHVTWALIAYAASFYIVCALPARFIRRHLPASMSPVACVTLTTTAALAGGVPAYLSAVLLVAGSFRQMPLTAATVADGLLVMSVVTVISVWRRRAAERGLASAQAHAHALQAQINPHFFFNTLNTIAALIPTDPFGAQQTVARLAEMSRYAFSSTEHATVPLAQEIQFARAYLEIERTRFGDRLCFELPDETSVDGLSLPPLTLQPLIENAVRHGIARRLEGGTVTVRIERARSGFSLVVENDTDAGERLAERSFFQPSHALTNIRERLALLGQGQASIHVAFPQPQRVMVTIRARAQPA